MTKELIPQNITAVKLFSENGLDPILDRIKTEADNFKADVETSIGRKDIASFAYKVAQSKTFIEKAGKELVSDQKASIKLIDNERKRSRDFLDDLKNKIRQPLTDFEDAEKERIEKERQIEIFNLDHEEAIGMEDLFKREKAIAEKEAEMERQEEEKRQKEEAEKQEKEQAEREELLKKEAADNAKREAEDKIKAEKERADRLSREAKESQEQAERDKVAATEKAKLEKEQAIQKAKDDAQAKMESEKRAEEFRIAEEKKVADRKAANLNHQRRINREALEDLMTIVDEEQGKKIIAALVNSQIRHIEINY